MTNIDITALSKRDQKLVLDLVDRLMKPKATRRLGPSFPYNRESFEKMDADRAAKDEAAETHWCSQCERRVQKDEATKCSSSYCGAKIAFEVTG